jgi:CheY-like chemotaxis protein
MPRGLLRRLALFDVSLRARYVQFARRVSQQRRAQGAAPSADPEPGINTVRLVDGPRDIDKKEPLLANDTSPGTWLGTIYCVESELGSGAMGTVLCAFDRLLRRKVAIKLIHSSLHEPDLRERFMLEARAMALVSHPNVVTIYALGEHNGQPFMVMELVRGQTLEQWLEAEQPHPDLDDALRILNQICLGVSAIHDAGTLHRDLKPSNILLDERLRARVSDLGLAVEVHDGELLKDVVGTPGYLAPEIRFDDSSGRGATVQSDVYSLACIAFELLTGTPPYDAADDLELLNLHATVPVPLASERRPGLPAAFDQPLQQGLAKRPAQRFQSVELLRRALLEAGNDGLEPMRILVAEDDAEFRDLLQSALVDEFPGAEVECVTNGRQAITAFDRKPASVVVLDLQMPEMDGIAVTSVLRARGASKLTPIIVVSASGGPNEWRRLAALGADRFFVKPVSLDDVLGSIRRASRERAGRSHGARSRDGAPRTT